MFFCAQRGFIATMMAEFGNQTVMDFGPVRKFTFWHKA